MLLVACSVCDYATEKKALFTVIHVYVPFLYIMRGLRQILRFAAIYLNTLAVSWRSRFALYDAVLSVIKVIKSCTKGHC